MKRHVLSVAALAAMVLGLVVSGSAASAAGTDRAATTAGLAPVLTATPNTDLLDLDQVDLHGTGFPQSPGVVAQCVVGGSCDDVYQLDSLGAADGTYVSFATVHVRTDLSGLPGGNCIATACEIRATLADGTVVARAPLTFRAGQPLPPYLTVTPDSGLHHDQTVLVTGHAYPPGQRVVLTECAGGLGLCGEALQSTAIDADVDGGFAVLVKVSRIIDGGSPGFPSYVDCATYYLRCWISGAYVAPSGPITFFGSGPLGFDASTPKPGTPPTLTFSPPRSFASVDSQVFDLANFTPGEPVRTRFCATRGLRSACGDWVTATPDASGAAHVLIQLRRLSVASDGTELDCVSNATCTVRAEGTFAYERVRTFVGFDSSSPIPGRPTLTLHDLTVTEGSDGGQTPARMRVTLSEPASKPLKVGWGTDIVIPNQFNPPGGSVTIPIGATEAVLPVRVVADRTDEPDLDVPVSIGTGTGYAVARAHATLRIRDDDAPSADPPAVAAINLGEGDENVGSARATIYLASPVQHRVVVHYRTVDATAVAGSDYVAKRSSIVFEAGVTRHVLRFQLLNDNVREGREHFHVVITKVDGGIAARGNNVDIFDND